MKFSNNNEQASGITYIYNSDYYLIAITIIAKVTTI